MPPSISYAIGLRCDAGPAMGVGHLIRSIALAEELLARGHRVVVLGEVGGLAWLDRQLADRKIQRVPAATDPAGLVHQVQRLGLDLVHLDGYQLSPALGEALTAAGIAVSTSCDGDFGADQVAGLYHDQNLGAVEPTRPRPGSRWLVGPSYVLLRDLVRRRAGQGRASVSATPRVLVVFGGSDPYRGAEVVLEVLAASALPMHVVVPTGRADLVDRVDRLPRSQLQVEATPVVDDLAALAVTCDAVVSAAGSTVWELLCLGVPTGLVCVTDNQRLGYRAVLAEQVAVGVGELAAMGAPDGRDAAVAAITTLLNDEPQRSARRERGLAAVDGDGRVRLADAMTELISGFR